jgi:hypothetical protein
MSVIVIGQFWLNSPCMVSVVDVTHSKNQKNNITIVTITYK